MKSNSWPRMGEQEPEILPNANSYSKLSNWGYSQPEIVIWQVVWWSGQSRAERCLHDNIFPAYWVSGEEDVAELESFSTIANSSCTNLSGLEEVANWKEFLTPEDLSVLGLPTQLRKPSRSATPKTWICPMWIQGCQVGEIFLHSGEFILCWNGCG